MRTSFTMNREDDGRTAVRDFPMGRMSVRRRLQDNANRSVEASDQTGKLPNDFYKLCPREQFLVRRGLFAQLLTYYKDLNRPDSKAMKRMNINSSSFKFKGLGSVPGVEVGDTFYYRAEMFVVGLHRAGEAGIACVNLGNERIACSVVVSGGYKDNNDLGDVIYYSGHGGNDKQRVGKREDQKLTRGNLGLFNSLKQRTPVRIIRGCKTRRGRNGKIPHKRFSYDGLYIVTEHVFVAGSGGHKVHRFKMVRQRGQPALS